MFGAFFGASKTFILNFASQTGSFHGFPFLHVPGLEVTNSKVIKITLMRSALKASRLPSAATPLPLLFHTSSFAFVLMQRSRYCISCAALLLF